MATEDDTFDIDIYGDDPSEPQPPAAEQANGDEYELDFSTANDEVAYQDDSTVQAVAGGEQTEEAKPAAAATQTMNQDAPTSQQGTKRKAPDDDFSEIPESDYDRATSTVDESTVLADARHTPASDPYAMPALRLTELQWWTTEEDLRCYCAKAGVEAQLKELSFGEHKINGKSRGEAYLEFESASAAEKVKVEVEKAVKASANESGAKRKEWLVEYTHVGNSFKMAASNTGPKKDYQQQSYNRGGYNNNNNSDRGSFSNRGNFRGGGGFQNRGGFNNNRGGMNQQPISSQGGWGAGNGMMPSMGGAGFNPMMAGMNMMGGFNNMGMGRGGGLPMMGMNRGGMMGMNMAMMGRGGWNGGFQSQGNAMGQQGWQGGGGGGMQQGNKRARME